MKKQEIIEDTITALRNNTTIFEGPKDRETIVRDVLHQLADQLEGTGEVDGEIIELLDEIIERRGPFDMDKLKHCNNVVVNASENAKKIKKRLTEKQ